MAILNRFSAILVYCDSAQFVLLLAAEFLAIPVQGVQARDSGNRAIRNSVPLSPSSFITLLGSLVF